MSFQLLHFTDRRYWLLLMLMLFLQNVEQLFSIFCFSNLLTHRLTTVTEVKVSLQQQQQRSIVLKMEKIETNNFSNK